MPPRRTPGITRRKNQDGSTSFEVRWRQGGGRAARNLSHTFAREREAIDTRTRILAAGSVCYCAKHAPDGSPASRLPGLLPDEAPLPPALTFGEYAKRHTAALTGVGEGYRRDMLRDVKRHLQSIADKPIDTVTELDVRELIRGMETGSHWWLHGKECARLLTEGETDCDKDCKAALSPTTIRRQLAQAGAIMEAAIRSTPASVNPFRGHRLARPVRDADLGMTFLTPHEWGLLEQALPEGVYRDLAAFLIGSGLRWGEGTALTVGAVDVLADPPRIHVRQAWKSDGKAGFVLGSPKSARSRRTLPIAAWVRDLLIPHVAGKADDDFVFTTPRGTTIRATNYWSRVWGPAVEKAQAKGLTKQPRIHDLRHTFVSWALAGGMPMYEVSRRVGHQSVQITDARYSHLLPEADSTFAQVMEQYRTRPVD